MEVTAFFEKKISLTPAQLNDVKKTPIESLLSKKAQELMEGRCSDQGFVMPGTLQVLSRSMGYFESARFTGDVNYYVKLQARVVYPVDGIRVSGEVIRKNKMGLYVNHRDAIRIQVPRDLHLGDLTYDSVQVGDQVTVEIKRSKYAINDTYILSSGIFQSLDKRLAGEEEEVPSQEEEEEQQAEESEEEVQAEEQAEESEEEEEEEESAAI